MHTGVVLSFLDGFVYVVISLVELEVHYKLLFLTTQ